MSTARDRDSELEDWAAAAHAWLAMHVPRRVVGGERASLALFHNLDLDAERRLVHHALEWQRTKFGAGYGAISVDPSVGGRGLSTAHLRVFERAEAEYETPEVTELVPVSLDLIAPTIARHGTEEQRQRFVGPILRGEMLACQLFSEPGAGSDLAGLNCSAVRRGDTWVVTGQKVWTSGAHLADVGLLIARTDRTQKHRGLTAFLVPMGADGMSIRPIRQMTGGSAFNEVFLDDVELSDDLRVGEVDGGWAVALTTLQFERAKSGSGRDPGGGFVELLATARRNGRAADPHVRAQLAEVYISQFVQERVAHAVVRQGVQGSLTAGGSLIKLLWVRSLAATARAASLLSGAHLTADGTGLGRVDGTADRRFEWGEHVLGCVGYSIAGGTDEIQRTIIGERLLGLPREPVQQALPTSSRA